MDFYGRCFKITGKLKCLTNAASRQMCLPMLHFSWLWLKGCEHYWQRIQMDCAYFCLFPSPHWLHDGMGWGWVATGEWWPTHAPLTVLLLCRKSHRGTNKSKKPDLASPFATHTQNLKASANTMSFSQLGLDACLSLLLYTGPRLVQLWLEMQPQIETPLPCKKKRQAATFL